MLLKKKFFSSLPLKSIPQLFFFLCLWLVLHGVGCAAAGQARVAKELVSEGAEASASVEKKSRESETSSTQPLSVEARYEAHNTSRDLLSWTVAFRGNFWERFDWSPSVRLVTSLQDIEGLSYGFQLSYRPVSWVKGITRIANEIWFGSTTSQTMGMVGLELFGSPTASLDLFVQGGLYQRWVHLTRATVAPKLWQPSYTDFDLFARVGALYRWDPLFSTAIQLGTVEDLSIYHLNNPYLEVSAILNPLNSSIGWRFFSRYQISLGFGRMDQFLTGLQLQLGV